MNHLLHTVTLRTESARTLTSMKKWCSENFGIQFNCFNDKNGEWTVYWSGGVNVDDFTWHFKNDKHQVLFALRWGSNK